MKKLFITLISLIIALVVDAQLNNADSVFIRSTLKLHGTKVSGISNDSTPISKDSTKLITDAAAKKYADANFQIKGNYPLATSIFGTNNQINVSSIGNSVTLSLPQNIDVNSNPRFNTVTGKGLTIIDNNGFSSGQISAYDGVHSFMELGAWDNTGNVYKGNDIYPNASGLFSNTLPSKSGVIATIQDVKDDSTHSANTYLAITGTAVNATKLANKTASWSSEVTNISAGLVFDNTTGNIGYAGQTGFKNWFGIGNGSTLNNNISGTAGNITATSNSTLTTLSALTTAAGGTFGSNAYSSIPHLPLTGGHITGQLTVDSSINSTQDVIAGNALWAGGNPIVANNGEQINLDPYGDVGQVTIGSPSNGVYSSLFVNGYTTTKKITLQQITNGSLSLDGLESTPMPGMMEIDTGKILHYTTNNSGRGVVNVEQFICLNADYTLVNQTGVQKLFNSTTNGQFNATPNTTYFIKGYVALSGLSSTSAPLSVDLAGTATYSSTAIQITGLKSSAFNGGSPSTSITTFYFGAYPVNIACTSANTGIHAILEISGTIRVNSGGTIIPSVRLNAAAAAVVKSGSYFSFTPLGNGSVTNVGYFN